MNDGSPSLNHAFASPQSRQRYVRRLFSTIADRYDLITVLLSFGLDRRWKRRAVSLAAPRPGDRALDLACGTGDIAFEVAGRGAVVTALDVTARMLQLGRLKTGRLKPASTEAAAVGAGFSRPTFVQADMMALPFADASFDVVTTGYGLRNVPELGTALREIHRVMRPGARFVSLDFNRPEQRLVRAVFIGYLTAVGSALGWVLHRDPDTYRYIPASIKRYPGARGVSERLRESGLRDVRNIAVLGGLMTIHAAKK